MTTNQSHLFLVAGCMNSGKSFHALGLFQSQFGGIGLAIKPKADSRNNKMIRSRMFGMECQAKTFDLAENIYNYVIHNNVDNILIDEGHMFGGDMYQCITRLLAMGKRIILSMLDRKWSGEFFNLYVQIRPLAFREFNFTAICDKEACQVPATFTYRKTNDQADILAGDMDVYGTYCEHHFNTK